MRQTEIYLDLFGEYISLINSSDLIQKLQTEMKKPAQFKRKSKRYTYLVLEMAKKKAPRLSWLKKHNFRIRFGII